MENIQKELFISFLCHFEKIRDQLSHPNGWEGDFRRGVNVKDAEVLAEPLGLTIHRLRCYVCQKDRVILLQLYRGAGQNDDGGYSDVCIISGRKVTRKDSKQVEPVCYDCLAGAQKMRERIIQAVDPALSRFDQLSISA